MALWCLAGVKPQPHLVLDVPSSVPQEMLSLTVISPLAYEKPALLPYICVRTVSLLPLHLWVEAFLSQCAVNLWGKKIKEGEAL